MILLKSCTGLSLPRPFSAFFLHLRSLVFFFFSFLFFLLPLFVSGQQKPDSLLSTIESTLPRVLSNTEQYIQKIGAEKVRAEAELNKIEGKLLKQVKKGRSKLELPEIPVLSGGSSLLPQSYVPQLDSLITSLKFLQGLEVVTSRIALGQSLSKLEGLQNEFNQLQYFRAEINVRKEAIEKKIASLGLKKTLAKYSASISKVQGHLQQLQNAYKEPDKVVGLAIRSLSQTKAFRTFFAKHSILSNFFRLPVEGESIDESLLAGLQTREKTEKLLNERFGTSSLLAHSERSDSQMPGMSSFLTMAGIERGLPIHGGTEFDASRQNISVAAKNKLSKKIKFGTDIQTVRASGIFPTMTDLGLSMGYSPSKVLTVGIGVSGRMGWGDQATGLKITGQGASLRSFTEVQIKGSFYASLNAEMNYFAQITKIDQLKDLSAWRFAGLAGVTKRFGLGRGKSTQVQLLYDFFHRANGIETQPLLFRVGYGF